MTSAGMLKDNEIVFFLGAGASAKAGVPDTFGLVEKFRGSLAGEESDLRAIDKILEILQSWSGEQGKGAPEVDVELLMETLERLETKDQDILLKFHTIAGYELSGHVAKKPLKDKLKDLIKNAGVVSASNVRYLEPLLGFLQENRPLEIVTVNYDVNIEQFCNVYKKEFVDGFDLYWNSRNFDRTDVDIKLYKLHGSILWYRTDRGYYVKLPTKIESARTELITGEQAVSLILYPVRKWDYAEPLLELLLRLKELLEKARFVIVVGYSFRDDHIRRIFWDAARTNKDLIMIFISPSSLEIYERKLRDYEIPELSHSFSSEFSPEDFDACFPSSLSSRVICLTHKFEDVLPVLKNRYLSELISGLASEQLQRETENQGKPSDWQSCLRSYANCEYVDKVAEISAKIDWTQFMAGEIAYPLEICLKALFSYLALGREKESNEWTRRLAGFFDLLTVDNLKVELISMAPFRFRMSFHSRNRPTIYLETLIYGLGEALESASIKRTVPQTERAQKVESILSGLKHLYDYLLSMRDELSLERYVKLEKNSRFAKWLETNVPELKKEHHAEKRTIKLEEVKNAILENEKRKLEIVFGGYKFPLPS